MFKRALLYTAKTMRWWRRELGGMRKLKLLVKELSRSCKNLVYECSTQQLNLLVLDFMEHEKMRKLHLEDTQKKTRDERRAKENLKWNCETLMSSQFINFFRKYNIKERHRVRRCEMWSLFEFMWPFREWMHVIKLSVAVCGAWWKVFCFVFFFVTLRLSFLCQWRASQNWWQED